DVQCTKPCGCLTHLRLPIAQYTPLRLPAATTSPESCEASLWDGGGWVGVLGRITLKDEFAHTIPNPLEPAKSQAGDVENTLTSPAGFAMLLVAFHSSSTAERAAVNR